MLLFEFIILMGLRNIGLILLVSISCICRGEDPGRSCSTDKPFRLSDNTCVNFTDICLKTDDQCKNFQTACKQCPPSNYSVIMYIDIMNLKNQLNTTNKNLEDLKNKFILATKDNPEKTNHILILCSTIIALFFIMQFILIIEYRFKIITKYCQRLNRKDSKYQFLSNRKREDNLEIMEQMNTKLQKWHTDFQENQKKNQSNHEELLDQFNKYQILLPKIKPAKVQINFHGEDDESTLLKIDKTSNVIQMKQQICAKLPHAKHDDYKIMKLKYNEIILDDNQYLLEIIDQSNTIVNYFIDSSMNASDIVVVKLQGKMSLPEIIQINKNHTIDQLKELIWKIIGSQDFSLFKEFGIKNKYVLIDSDLIKSLEDGDFIHVILRKMGKLIIKSIFDNDFSISVEYANIESVSSLIDKIYNNYNWDRNNFILFYKNEHVEEKKYFFEFESYDESAFRMCNIAKFSGISKDKLIEMGGFWDLHFASKIDSHEKLLLKTYKNINLESLKTEERMLNELKIFTITKSQSRFIQLNRIYINESVLYVAMENMVGGTLKYYLHNNKNINEYEIDKWITQIAQALDFLHQRKVIHRDLNPSNILVGENVDLKLSSFNLSKYEEECHICSIMERNKEVQLKIKYMAPEILGSKEYGFPCDIWSLGAVLVRIVTGKAPFPKLSKDQTKLEIIQSGTITYEFPEQSYGEDIKLLIDSMLRENPADRCTMSILMENQLIKNYLLSNN